MLGLPEISAPEAWGIFWIYSVAQKGIGELLDALWERSRKVQREEEGDEDEQWWTP